MNFTVIEFIVIFVHNLSERLATSQHCLILLSRFNFLPFFVKFYVT